MKIGSLTSVYAAGTNYSFQYTPKIIGTSVNTKKSMIDLPFMSISSYLDFSSVTPLNISLVGTVYGTDKLVYLNKLSYWILSKGMKKLYLDSSTFMFCIGQSVKTTKDGKKFNFRDYVATASCPIPFIYGVTKQSYVVTDLSTTATNLDDSTANSTGAFANTGYAPAHIYHIQFAVQAGSANMTGFSIGDKALDTTVKGDNIITWSDTTGIAAGETLHAYLLYEYGSKGNKWYFFKDAVDGTVVGNRTLSGDNREDGPRIDGLQTDQDFSIKLEGGDNVDVTFEWYNSNYAGF